MFTTCIFLTFAYRELYIGFYFTFMCTCLISRPHKDKILEAIKYSLQIPDLGDLRQPLLPLLANEAEPNERLGLRCLQVEGWGEGMTQLHLQT